MDINNRDSFYKIYVSENKLEKKKYNRLKDYIWGIGIEHESHIYHTFESDIKKPKKNFILFNTKDAMLRSIKLMENDPELVEQLFLTKEQYHEIFSKIDYEKTGRKCRGKVVSEPTPFEMPEFITTKPISTYKNGDFRSMDYYINDLLQKEDYFINILMKDKLTNHLINKYGILDCYPFGMTSYYKTPLNGNVKEYKFEKKKVKTTKNGKNKYIEIDKTFKDYTGSYHITMTLPYKSI